jgi:hypothetical protein
MRRIARTAAGGLLALTLVANLSVAFASVADAGTPGRSGDTELVAKRPPGGPNCVEDEAPCPPPK